MQRTCYDQPVFFGERSPYRTIKTDAPFMHAGFSFLVLNNYLNEIMNTIVGSKTVQLSRYSFRYASTPNRFQTIVFRRRNEQAVNLSEGRELDRRGHIRRTKPINIVSVSRATLHPYLRKVSPPGLVAIEVVVIQEKLSDIFFDRNW